LGDPPKVFEVDVDVAKLNRSVDSIVIAERQMLLRDGIAALNAKASVHEIGSLQPPLTEDEVVGSIRRWLQGRSISEEQRTQFEEIADTGILNPGDELSFLTRMTSRGQRFTVWWLDLTVNDYRIRIRDRTISSRALSADELAAHEEASKRIEAWHSIINNARGDDE
jgi:hypothetical protein